VIFGPIFAQPDGSRAYSGEDLRSCLNTAGLLAEAGIPLALTAGDLGGESALPHQACFAIRHGLSFEAAMKATTSMPAGILGVADRVGALEQGMDADLVLWKGKPFAPASRPVLVMIQGEVVLQDEELSPGP
jgi:imidazolonepropionase-like amidohydrolase